MLLLRRAVVNCIVLLVLWGHALAVSIRLRFLVLGMRHLTAEVDAHAVVRLVGLLLVLHRLL